MYSVVLMMAMTTSVDTPDLGRHGCNGGYAGCNGGYGGCYGGGGCHGGGLFGGGHGCHGGRLFGGGHGCHGGRLFGGGHGCHGGGYGCNGGGYGCHGGGYGCNGGGYGCNGGGYGCHGGAGCSGGVVAPMPPEPVKPPKPEKEAMLNAPATIIVSLPSDAKLTIDGAATTSTSAERTFISPELPVDRSFNYSLQAEFQLEGRTVTVSKMVSVRAGMESRVTIGAADLAGVVSR
jgi:uncharacterized protein (TIGR03000 family)